MLLFTRVKGIILDSFIPPPQVRVLFMHAQLKVIYIDSFLLMEIPVGYILYNI